jgi:tripartite-type tricarboxylate transporter receptor subunit TctC
MKLSDRRKVLRLAAGAAALPALSGIAHAQAYPSRPITIVVPFVAGGATDVIARMMADRMRLSLGQPVIVENVSGAGGTIGVGRVAHSVPDGYTLSIGHWSTHVVNGAIYSLQYDLLNDFDPILLITSNTYLVLARKTMPASNLRELIAWIKANPGKVSAGTAGAGSPQHIGGLFFQKATGTRFQFVPYRGGAPMTQDLVAGQIDITIDDPTNSMTQLRADAIKAYAVTAKTRLAAVPDIPTVDEAGLPGFYFSRWHALWAPKGTPKDVIAKLNAASIEALADPAVRARLADLAQEIYPRKQQTPEALGAFHKAEIDKWWPIIKAANIKGD